MAEKKISIDEWYDFVKKDWYSHENIDFESAKEQYKKNISALKKAQEDREKENRPLYVTVIHGSGRHEMRSCAREMSNSQMFLDHCLDEALDEWEGEVEVEKHVLREKFLSPCNGCVSTASALCSFPCLPSSERVVGDKIKSIAEIKPGDKISDNIVTQSGKTAEFAHILKIQVSDGRQIRVTPNHLIEVSKKLYRTTKGFGKHSDGRYRYGTVYEKKWKRADEIEIGDLIEYPLGGIFQGTNFSCPFIPYLAGLIWGDGSFGGKKQEYPYLYYSEKDQNFADIIISLSPYSAWTTKHSTNTSTNMRRVLWKPFVKEFLLSFGLEKTMPAKERKIPQEIMNASEFDVRSFIAGWFDTDGTVGKTQICFDNTSKEAIRDLQLLLMKLGIKSSISDLSHLKIKGAFKNTSNKLYSRVTRLQISGNSINVFRELIPIKHPDKLRKLASLKMSGRDRKCSPVVSVEPDGTADVYDIEVMPSHKFNAEGFIVHNCSCFPKDSTSTDIYPSVMKADLLLFSTPVNQAGVSSRLDIVLSRLISLDGGYVENELPMKDEKFREEMIQLSLDKPVYDKRMFGKVAAYFVTSKDLNNTNEEGVPVPEEFKDVNYIDLTVGRLAIQGSEYGWHHADNFYAVHAANPDVEYVFDKEDLNKNMPSEEGVKVIIESLKLADKFRKEPPVLKNPGRYNRT